MLKRVSLILVGVLMASLIVGLESIGFAAEKKIVLWHIQTTEPATSIIADSAARFEKDHPGVKVEVVPIQNDPYKVKIKVAMGAGTPPDVWISWGGGPLEQYVRAGQVLDLTPYLKKDNWINRFIPAGLDLAKFNGKYYGIPVENMSAAFIWYNKKTFNDVGVGVPQTYDELLQIVKKLKSKGVIPISLANKTKWPGSMWYMYLVDRLGSETVFENAVNRTGSFEDPVFIKAGEEIRRLVGMGAFPPGFNGMDWDTGQSRMLLYTGKAGMELMGSWLYATAQGEAPQFAKNIDFFPFPVLTHGKGDPTNLIGTPGDNYYSVSAVSKYKDEAVELIKYIIDDTAVEKRLAAGRIPPVKGIKLTDPILQRVHSAFAKAHHVQLWYDQYLPPELGEVHKDTCQAIFGGAMTPEQAAKEMEKAAGKFWGK
ncbi:MAG TPA: extracellular solute-binding protein [Firmicutes bacterium]|nr:extracellular solute-binding protein [Bacillota bacterium]